jgi:hypothetical protein
MWVPDPPKNRTPLIAGIIAGVVVVAAVVVSVLYFTVWSKDSAPQSDEAQITTIVEQFETAWNDTNFDAFKPITCKAFQSKNDFNEEDFKKAREDGPKIDITVQSVKVTGDKATATVKNGEGKIRNIGLIREDDSWKLCDFTAETG